MNSEKKINLGSIMNIVEQTATQMTFFESIFNSIYVHVALVSAFQTCCDDYLKIIHHMFLHNLLTHFQLMVHLLNMCYR